MLGGIDPAADLVARAALDRRPAGWDPEATTPPAGVVVAGPDDLRELRAVVERVTGVGSWPTPVAVDGPRVTDRLAAPSPAALLGLLVALEGHIERRSPWSTWRGVVDALAGPVGNLTEVTIDAVLVAPDPG